MACFWDAVRAVADWIGGIAPAVAWPIVALILIGWFRKQIRELIPRLVKWKVGPFEAETASQQSATPPAQQLTALAVNVPADETVEGAPDLVELEKRFEADLGVVDREKQIPLLIRRLAEARLAGFFEWINNLIFESQLEGLRQLLARGGSVSRSEAEEFFERVRSLYPAVHRFGFDGWLGYLERNGLTSREGDTIKLTGRGRAFLKYVQARHAGEAKPF